MEPENIFGEENEGKINIPKVLNLSQKFSLDKLDNVANLDNLDNPLKIKRNKSKSNHMKNSSFCFQNKYILDDKINNNDLVDKNKSCMKIEENNRQSPKIKKVKFAKVEIIGVKNYKRYNKLNASKINDFDNQEESSCILF